MSSVFDEAVRVYAYARTDVDMQVSMDKLGRARIEPKPPEVRADLDTLETAMGPMAAFAPDIDVARMTGEEFLPDRQQLEIAAGLPKGMAEGFLGIPGDIYGLIAAAGKAGAYAQLKEIFPEDYPEQSLMVFAEEFGEISKSYGTEYFSDKFDGWLNKLPIDEATKENIRMGSGIGQFFGIPGAGIATAAGVKGIKAGAKTVAGATQEFIEGAPARVAAIKADTSVQLNAGFDPTMLADRAILAAKSFFGGDDPATPTVLLPPTDKPKAEAAGLDPEYRVTVGGFEPDKAAAVPIKLTPNNSEAVVSKMDNIEQEYPDPLSSPDNYAQMVARTKNADEISAPPTWLIEHANDTEKWAGWFNNLTPDQIEGARQGLAVQEDFKQAYTGGADETLTGQLMLWAILSRRMSAYPHEAGYLELAEAAQPFIEKAARGEWTEADSIAWKEMAMSIMPEEGGSPGRSATSNANAFGETWLRKMAATDENGVSALTRLHNMIADPNMSSKDIRRQYYTLADATGIGNKVLSFALLVSGRNDVVVLDRIQINTMWGGGDKIYDDIMMQFEGAQGLVQYEALERSLMTRVPDLYSAVGRPEDGSVGRYHWESWVLSSGQIVSHPTLEAVVGMGTKRPGANISPTELMPITEGRFHAKHSGVSFEKLPGGKSRFVYNTSGGEPYQFTREELDAMFKEVFSKKSGVLPPDFPGVKAFEGGNIPWYEYEGVNRGKFDAIIAKYGQPKEDL